MAKKLMVLGGGVSQLPLIRRAKELGLRVIVVSKAGDYPGLLLADSVWEIDTTDAEGIAAAALREKIDGVCTTGTDVAIPAVGRTAAALGMAGVPYESALLCSDKRKMKEALVRSGIRTAPFVTVSNEEEARAAFERFGAPVMFKAVDGAASKGIVRVDSPEHIGYAFSVAMAHTRKREIIVEAFIQGVEFGAQAFVYRNKLMFVLSHGDTMFHGDAGVPVGHYMPLELSAAAQADVERTLVNSVRALGMNHCAVNADLMLCGDEVYVLEIGARAGATCLPELVSTYLGFDYYEQMIRAALGMRPQFPMVQSAQPCACCLLMSPADGRIARQAYGGGADPDVLDVSFDYDVGDTVRRFRIGTDRIGHVIAKGANAAAATAALERARAAIAIEIDAH